jgi:hypothetical protein
MPTASGSQFIHFGKITGITCDRSLGQKLSIAPQMLGLCLVGMHSPRKPVCEKFLPNFNAETPRRRGFNHEKHELHKIFAALVAPKWNDGGNWSEEKCHNSRTDPFNAPACRGDVL